MWLIVIACAFIHIISIKTGPKWLFFLTKPLPIVAMIGMLLLSPSNHLPYTQWIIAGLSISLIGDLVMMHPKDKFILGIKLFCLALICYALGFINMAAWHFTPWLPFAVFGVGSALISSLNPIWGKRNGQLPVTSSSSWPCCGCRWNTMPVVKPNLPHLQF